MEVRRIHMMERMPHSEQVVKVVMEPQTPVMVEHLVTDQMEHLAVVVQQLTTEHLVMEELVMQDSLLEEVAVEVATVMVVTELLDKVEQDITQVVVDQT
tara:strand:- start:98 stop:394 length:297 start_codon:yes stop_codon:yes gene_type:complete